MTVVSRAASLVRNVFLRDRVERDLDAEIRAYVELLVEEKVAAGMSPAAARRSALIEAGGVEQVKEEVRDARAGAVLETVLQDLRYGLRALGRSPGFTVAAVLTLGLGIGATTAIFSVVDGVLLRPLPYASPERLVVILHRESNPVAPANFLDWQRQASAFDRMGAAEAWSPNLTGEARPEQVPALRVTVETLPMLGVPPALGRLFLPEEMTPGREREVVLGHGLWKRRFGGDPGVLGRRIVLDGEAHTVVGVMPRGFAFPPFWASGTELFAPLALGDRAASRGGNSLRVFARLSPGTSLARARTEMAAISGRLEKEFPGSNRDVTVVSLTEKVVGTIRPALLVLLGAVVLVLLIACANIAHMLLARAAGRHREMAIRTAVGAGRWRLVRQLLTESLVLGVVGGGAGLLLGGLGARALVRLAPAGIPRVDTVALDGRALLFTLALSLLTSVVFGLVPALQASTLQPVEALRDGARGSSEGVGRGRLRRLLVASEFALALMLLAAAGLVIRSLLAIRGIDGGFDPRGVLTAVVPVTGTRTADPARRARFFQEVLERVRALPGVRSASAINHLPLAGDVWGLPFVVEGRPSPKPGEAPTATYRVILPGYFETMRIPVLKGRDVTAGDRVGTAGVVVVNERLAALRWPGEDPIGKRLSVEDGPDGKPVWVTVAGVVKNVVRSEWTAPPEEEMYLPYLQSRAYLEGPGSHVAYLSLVVRTDGDPVALGPALRRAVASLSEEVPVERMQSMESIVERANAVPRFHVLLLGAFAAAALVLAAVGTYGVMSYTVTRRAHELGIRMALGAGRRDVMHLVLGEGLRVAAWGTVAGLCGALALTRLMSRLLYGVRATDPVTFLVVAAVLTCVAVLASYFPARRATRIEPLTALRFE